MKKEINKALEGIDNEHIELVQQMIGKKTACDIEARLEAFADAPANGDSYGQMMFARGVIWACLKINERRLADALATKMAGTIWNESREALSDAAYTDSIDAELDERESVLEIYKGIGYRYYPEDIKARVKDRSYVNARDEAGNNVVLQLKDGAICGVAGS